MNVIVMPPTRPMRNCSVLGAAYMPSGCNSRDTSSAPINRCTHDAARPDISSIATISVMIGHVFDEIGMRADRAAQLQASVVAERGPVALAQPADLNGEHGVEQGEKGEIG